MRTPRQLKNALLWVSLAGYVGFCIGAFWSGWRAAEKRNRVEKLVVENRFDQLEWGLKFYHQAHGAFPPTKYQPEPDGPVHSWRVLMVPFADGDEGYLDYDFSQEWNSPHNFQALSNGWGVVYYRIRGGNFWARGIDDTATILAIGKDDEWPSKAPLWSYLVKKGKDRFLLVEYPDSKIHWMEPKY